MAHEFIGFIVPAIIGLVVILVVNFSHRMLNHPKREGNRQRPGTFPKFLLRFLIILDGFMFLLAAAGVWMREKEMAIVCGIIAWIFFVAIVFVKKAYNTSYLETEHYIELKNGKKIQQVFYEDIVNWYPSYNEIIIIDKTKPERERIRVNLKIFKPEILLRKIADMAFEEKFTDPIQTDPSDPHRKIETIRYIVSYHYGYLVEDYIEQIED